MVLGIAAFMSGGITGLVGAPLGHVALRRSRAIDGKGRAQAITGIVCSYAAIALIAMLIVLGVVGPLAETDSGSNIDVGADVGASQPGVLDDIPGEPVLDIASGMTWRQLIDAIADDGELACIDDSLGDDLPEELLGITVTDPIGWPIVTRELFTIDIGDDRWPHELWRCLAPETAAAVYISIRVEEARIEGFDITARDEACLVRLPADAEIANAVTARLSNEHSLSETEGLSGFFATLDDEVVLPRLLPCISDAVSITLDSMLIALYGDAFDEGKLACARNEIMDDVSRGAFDLAPLFSDDTPDEFFDEYLFPALEAAAETCLMTEADSGSE